MSKHARFAEYLAARKDLVEHVERNAATVRHEEIFIGVSARKVATQAERIGRSRERPDDCSWLSLLGGTCPEDDWATSGRGVLRSWRM